MKIIKDEMKIIKDEIKIFYNLYSGANKKNEHCGDHNGLSTNN